MPPPLPPSHCGTPLSPKGKDIVVELFLDLVCPFSSKMYKVVFDEVLAAFGDKVSFVVHQVWHTQSRPIRRNMEFCLALLAALLENNSTDPPGSRALLRR